MHEFDLTRKRWVVSGEEEHMRSQDSKAFGDYVSPNILGYMGDGLIETVDTPMQ